jgi:hypothetical protein
MAKQPQHHVKMTSRDAIKIRKQTPTKQALKNVNDNTPAQATAIHYSGTPPQVKKVTPSAQTPCSAPHYVSLSSCPASPLVRPPTSHTHVTLEKSEADKQARSERGVARRICHEIAKLGILEVVNELEKVYSSGVCPWSQKARAG